MAASPATDIGAASSVTYPLDSVGLAAVDVGAGGRTIPPIIETVPPTRGGGYPSG